MTRAEFVDVAWIGEQAVVFGYDEEGEFHKRELAGNQMSELLEMQERHSTAEQELLDRLLFERAVFL